MKNITLAFALILTAAPVLAQPGAPAAAPAMQVDSRFAGWLGSFWSSMGKANFFVMIAAIAAVAGLMIWSFNRPLKPILKE